MTSLEPWREPMIQQLHSSPYVHAARCLDHLLIVSFLVAETQSQGPATAKVYWSTGPAESVQHSSRLPMGWSR